MSSKRDREVNLERVARRSAWEVAKFAFLYRVVHRPRPGAADAANPTGAVNRGWAIGAALLAGPAGAVAAVVIQSHG